MTPEQKRYYEGLDRFAELASEYLLGYREGSVDDMLPRIVHLVNIEKQHRRQEQVAKLFIEIHALHELVQDIESGYES